MDLIIQLAAMIVEVVADELWLRHGNEPTKEMLQLLLYWLF